MLQKGWAPVVNDCKAEPEMRSGIRERPYRFEVFAGFAVADVELVADHRKPHRMGAVQQLAVLDRMKADVSREVGRPAAVPARAMARLGLHYFVCCGT